MMSVRVLDVYEVRKYEEEISSLLDKLEEYMIPWTNLDSLKRNVMRMKYKVYGAFENRELIGLALTSVIDYGKHKCLDWSHVCGDKMHEWFPMFYERFEEERKAKKCRYISGEGRLALGRVAQRVYPNVSLLTGKFYADVGSYS